MRKLKISLVIVVLAVLSFYSVAFAEEKKVKVDFDNSKNKVTLSTQEEGQIVYAYKYSGGTIERLDGTLVSSGEENAIWAVASIDKNGVETNYSEDKNTWTIYDEKTFDSYKLITGDRYIFLYACVRYPDGTFSDSEYTKIDVNTEVPVVSSSVTYVDNKSKAIISINVTSNVDIEYIENCETGEVVRGKKSAEFTVSKNNTYVVSVKNVLGNFEDIVVRVFGIKSASTKYQKSYVDEDNVKPTITFEGVDTNKNSKGFTLTIKAVDKESGIAYIYLPTGAKEEADVVTMEIKENGNYTFEAVDNFGNRTSKTLKVKNISTVKDAKDDGKTGSGFENMSNKEDLSPFESDGTTKSFGTLPQTGGNVALGYIVTLLGVTIVFGVAIIIFATYRKTNKVKSKK